MFYPILLISSILGIIIIFLHRYILTLKGHKWQKKVLQDESTKTDLLIEKTINKEKIAENNPQFYPDTIRIKTLLKDAELLFREKNFKEAERKLIELLSLSQNNEEAQSLLAKIYIELEMFAKAQSIYEELTQHFQNPVYFNNLGLCYFVLNNLKESLISYEKALELDNTKKERYMNLARVYEQMGELEKAQIQYENWCIKEPKDIDALLILAAYAEKDNETLKAVQIYNRILDLSPYHEIAKAKTHYYSKSEI
jgi:tetratricopeptide (TPR) repeat protein